MLTHLAFHLICFLWLYSLTVRLHLLEIYIRSLDLGRFLLLLLLILTHPAADLLARSMTVKSNGHIGARL